MRRWRDRQTDTHTDTHMRVTNIHFTSAIPHTKRNDSTQCNGEF